MSGFDRFKALSFDCYGTLIDWETGIVTALQDWAGRVAVEASDAQMLRFVSEIETVVQGEHSPALLYPEVLAEVLRRIGSRLGTVVSDQDAAGFGRTVGDWPPFADSASALARLGRRFRLLIVSNVDRSSFAATSRHLGVTFDKVITAEDVGAYKPRPPHFEALFESIQAMGVERYELLHVAQSLYHDHEPARRYGLQSVWIDRGHDRDDPGAAPSPVDASVRPRWRFPTLEAFADAVESPP